MLDTAIILAGGEGTRLRPLTHTMPKPMVPINNKPLIAHLVDQLAAYGIKHVCLGVGYKAEQIAEYFDKTSGQHKPKITYCIEKEKLGTGGGLKLALKQLGTFEDILVLNADSLYMLDLKKMYELHKKNKAVLTIGTIQIGDIAEFGSISKNGAFINKFVEKTGQRIPGEINTGFYIINHRLLSKLPDKSSFSLERDVFEDVVGKEIVCSYVLDAFYTVNTVEQYENMKKLLDGKI